MHTPLPELVMQCVSIDTELGYRCDETPSGYPPFATTSSVVRAVRWANHTTLLVDANGG